MRMIEASSILFINYRVSFFFPNFELQRHHKFITESLESLPRCVFVCRTCKSNDGPVSFKSCPN